MAAPEGFTDTAALAPHWWTPPWDTGTDPDGAWSIPGEAGGAWHETGGRVPLDDSAILDPLEEQFGEQVRSRDRVRDLAEVFTHQREVDAMLDLSLIHI